MLMAYAHHLAPQVPTCFKVLLESNSTLHQILSSALSLHKKLRLLMDSITKLPMSWTILPTSISLIVAYLEAHLTPSSQQSPSAWIVSITTNSNSETHLWQLLLHPSLCSQILLVVPLARVFPKKRSGLNP